jgi:hypothetical protein
MWESGILSRLQDSWQEGKCTTCGWWKFGSSLNYQECWADLEGTRAGSGRGIWANAESRGDFFAYIQSEEWINP